MKKETKYLILVIAISIISIIAILFCVNKYSIYKANKETENITIGDNENIVDTTFETIEQDIIHYDNEIGILTIPNILLENAPIRESVELSTLSKTIGHFPSTSIYEGNVGLASHNSGNQGDFFKNLKNIKVGDEIYYQTEYGTKRYIVETKAIINEEDWSYLKETEDNRITLITCVKGQPDKRLCVQGIESMEGLEYGQ